MKRGWKVCAVIALMAFAGGAGCATIMKGTRQRVSISAVPSGSQVTIYDDSGSLIVSQMAPVTVRLRRASGLFSPAAYRVQVEKQGYTPAIFTISGSLSGWYTVGNLISFQLFGWLIVDPLTGAMWTLRPRTVDAVLAPQTSSLPGRDATLHVTLRSQALPAPSE